MDLLDRQHLDRFARELTDVAAQVRQSAAGIRGQAAGMAWHSPAAAACTRSLELLLLGVLRLAGGLEDTATAAGEHGRRAYERAERAKAVAVHGVHLVERLAGR